MKKYFFILILLLTFLSYFYIIQCNGSSETAANTTTTPHSTNATTTTKATNVTTSTGTSPTAKVLDSVHTGWQQKQCGTAGCHPTLSTIHTVSSPCDCGACHGGNGACNPNGPVSGFKSHYYGSSCLSGCHAGHTTHGFTAEACCRSCHFASAGGIADCTTSSVKK